jgi:hypothetical protein
MDNHVKSEMHRMAEDLHKKETGQRNAAGSSVESVRMMNEAQNNKIFILLRSAHAIAKERQLFTDFIWMCQLNEAKGLDVGATYRNDIACRNFIHHIAEEARDCLKQDLKKASFLSLSCDGSTDVSVKEQEVIVVSFVVKHYHSLFALLLTIF